MLIRMSQDVSSPMILPPSEPSGISITASGILNATASSYSMDSSATGEVLSKSLPKDLIRHAICCVVDKGSWIPFRMARHVIPLSHLFFVDDLILYAKASVDQAQVVKGILDEFGVYSSHRVSVRKLQATYFDFILSRLRAMLNGWVASSLLMACRVTLAKSILVATHAFFMQTIKFSTSVCAKIDKIVCGFIWGSSASAHKFSLVNWFVTSQPRGRGGLAIKNLFWVMDDGNYVHLWNVGADFGSTSSLDSSTSTNIELLSFEDLLLDDGK
ncbi:hypothetical protein V6N11_039072 [Hibiscus sabdariffa]|uniref:Reverse transcriptase n=1 Tax=Hibiscus sabdariffa TaxID=183260 RepID=A0ABR2SMQ7_9ROSI